MSPELARTVVLTIFASLVIVAAVTDLASFTIPNWVSVSLALAFVPAAFLTGHPLGASLETLWHGLAIGAGFLMVGMIMFALGWLGGGDAKLMAAAAMWLGLPGLGPFVVFTGLAGGALALALLGLRSDWLRPWTQMGPAWARRLATPGESAPYGVAICVGALAAFAAHPLI